MRINQTELNQAIASLPSLSDPANVAIQKIQNLQALVQAESNAHLTPQLSNLNGPAPVAGDTHSFNGVNYKLVDNQWVKQ